MLQSTPARAGVDHDELAHTILHELGHTLGLCHVELAACFANLSAVDQADAGSSSMFSGSAGTLHFLPSEWDHVRTSLTRPRSPSGCWSRTPATTRSWTSSTATRWRTCSMSAPAIAATSRAVARRKT